MDIFEKQQTIETIRTVVKARWFFILSIVIQSLIVKIFFKGVPLPNSLILILISLNSFIYNFGYWAYLRRPPEKISNFGLQAIKFSQVFADQLSFGAILYFSGTANKMLFVAYFIIVMFSICLYGRKGVILTAVAGAVLYSGIVVLEYFGFLPFLSPETFSQSPTKSLAGQLILAKGQLVGFNLYLLAATTFAVYLGWLFKIREKRLKEQKDELVVKAQILTTQTQELTQAKDQLQGAFTKSDIARKAATQARDEMEKVNLELKKKIDELEKFYKITVGREVRMVELKEKIKELEKKIKKEEEN